MQAEEIHYESTSTSMRSLVMTKEKERKKELRPWV